MSSPIRVLVVDDTRLVRLMITELVRTTTDIQVVGEAETGAQAVELAKSLKPDIITMDVRMPGMSGIDATRAIMADQPVPILVFSSFTTDGAPDTIAALQAGAVEAMPKGSGGSLGKVDTSGLLDKIRYWGRRKLPAKRVAGMPATPAPARPLRAFSGKPHIDLVVVGISTGGPSTLPGFLKAAGKLSCPMLIAQHMPSFFTGSFAARMALTCHLNVVEGQDGMIITPDMVVILPGSADSGVERRGDGKWVFRSLPLSNDAAHPSANVLFDTALKAAKSPAAVVMTGMGSDGSRGAAGFIPRNLPVLVQTPETCVVAGMPQASINSGAATHVMTPEELGAQLKQWCGMP